MNLNNLKNKRILILGLGREGRASFLFLKKKLPNAVFGFADQLEFGKLGKEIKNLIKKNRKIGLHLGLNYLGSVRDYDVIVKSPGIPGKTLELFLKKDQKIISQTEIFMDNCKGKIIGITGTKGKSTVSAIIYEVLKKSGVKDLYFKGNIGDPALPFLEKSGKKSVFVYEMSSHQLVGLKKSPNIAVLLNIFPEHLDYYKNFDDYVSAKSNIARWQKKNDILIFHKDNKFVNKTAALSKAKKFTFGLKKGKIRGCFLKNNAIYYWDGKSGEEKIIETREIKIPGIFNVINCMPAVIIGKLFGIGTEEISRAIQNFRGLPHRLEFSGEYRAIKFYNDSLATIPEATIEALNVFGRNVETLIAGGYDRGLSFQNFAKKIISSNVKNLILFSVTGQRIWNEIENQIKAKKGGAKKEIRHFFVSNMEEAVKIAYQYTSPKKICLLSCASPSFGIFRDYKDRGDQFKYYVKKIGVVR